MTTSRVLQEVLAVDAADVSLARREHHWHDVDRYLVHEVQRQGLPTDVAGRHRNDARASKILRLGDGRWHIVDKVVRRLRVPLIRLRSMRHTARCSPAGGLPSQRLVRSRRCRPITVVPMPYHIGRSRRTPSTP